MPNRHSLQLQQMYWLRFEFKFCPSLSTIIQHLKMYQVAQGTGQVLVNMMTAHRCQCFLYHWFMSSCHSTSSPFICHERTFIQSRAPSQSLQSLRKVIWCVIVSPICILLLDFPQKKDMIFLLGAQWPLTENCKSAITKFRGAHHKYIYINMQRRGPGGS